MQRDQACGDQRPPVHWGMGGLYCLEGLETTQTTSGLTCGCSTHRAAHGRSCSRYVTALCSCVTTPQNCSTRINAHAAPLIALSMHVQGAVIRMQALYAGLLVCVAALQIVPCVCLCVNHGVSEEGSILQHCVCLISLFTCVSCCARVRPITG